MVDYPDVVNLSRDELHEEFCKLFDRYQELCETNESDTQKIHDLKRSLDTATAAQAYLSQELEQYTNVDNKEIEVKLHKTQSELQDVRNNYGSLKTSLASLQQDYNTLLEENAKITKNLEESLKHKQQHSCEEDGKIVDDLLLRIQSLETDNTDLLQKIEEFEERTVLYTLTIAEYEKNIEILTDQITCLEENLQSKRNDLEEKVQIIESTQDQLAEANAKIALLSSAADDKGHKGNSLFAEVDDQRQAMKHLLKAQKKSYTEMKKIYNESEHEIRRLKRENISMRTEFEACSEIFCNADKIYQEKLNERIRILLNQNDDIERKLKWTQERLKELAVNKGVLFYDSMLSFCKKETDELKSQLHRVRLQNASLEEQLRIAQQDMARWRFESLKSRCILIDREDLLTQNKINFKPIHAVEYKISEKDQKEAKPRIVSNRRSSILDSLNNRKSTSPSNVLLKQDTNISPQVVVSNKESLNDLCRKKELIFDAADQDKKTCKLEEQEFVDSEMNGIIKTEIDSSSVSKFKMCDSSSSINPDQYNANKENSIICLDDTPILDNFASLRAKPPSPPSPMRPSQNASENHRLEATMTPVRSILTKDDLLINTSKHVKFSSAGDTVYNISTDTTSPADSSINTTTDDNAGTTHIIKTISAEKQTRTKSNIVVRRVVVSSKHD